MANQYVVQIASSTDRRTSFGRAVTTGSWFHYGIYPTEKTAVNVASRLSRRRHAATRVVDALAYREVWNSRSRVRVTKPDELRREP